jgi:hypothetical protein
MKKSNTNAHAKSKSAQTPPNPAGIPFASPGLSGLMVHGPDIVNECLAELLYSQAATLLPVIRRHVKDPWRRLCCLNALALAESAAHLQGIQTELAIRERTRLRRLAAGLPR